MPGFLEVSGYDGTTKIDLGNGYWAEVKNCLTNKEASLVEAALIGNHRLGDDGQAADLNSRANRTEMVVQSLVAWNIDDADGTVWSLEPGQSRQGAPAPKNPYLPGGPRRQSVARLPEPVFEQIWQQCDKMNSPRKGPEAASFPEQDERGDQDGDTGTAGPGPVPDGTGVLEAAGADAG